MRCVPPQSNIKCPTPFGHALDLMKVQVEEHGAKALKFYNVRYDYGQPFPWRMDDPRVAYPAFEQALKLGVNLIGVHKGVPLGPQPIEHTQTWDVDGAAAKFPDVSFVIFHVGLPFIDEVCWQLVRYPNLYASIAATVNFMVRSPRVFAENMASYSGVARTRLSIAARRRSGIRAVRRPSGSLSFLRISCRATAAAR